MPRTVLKEALIVSAITLVFLLISATVGISTNTPPASPTAEAAEEGKKGIEDHMWFNDFLSGFDTETVSHHILKP